MGACWISDWFRAWWVPKGIPQTNKKESLRKIFENTGQEVLSEKMCMWQSRKIIWDMINTLFLMTVAVLLLLSFSSRKHMSVAFSAILSNFFEEQCTQNHPHYLSGLSHGLSLKLFLKIAVYITAILMTTGTFFIICTDQQ